MAYENIAVSGVTETPVPSAARTATGTTGPLEHIGVAEVMYALAKTIRAQLNVTAASGTSPTLDAVIQDSLDGGVTWNTIGTFAQKTAVAREVINITAPFSDMLRVQWTIAGTTPSFTFAVDWYVEQ